MLNAALSGEQPTFSGAPMMLAPHTVAALADQLPQAPFWIKDDALRYIAVNSAMTELCGARSRVEMVGRRAGEFFPPLVSARQEMQDRLAMRRQRYFSDHLELCYRLRGRPLWVLTRRCAVVDPRGVITGVVGIARKLEPDKRHPTYERVAFVIDHLHENFRGSVDIGALARRCGVSASQLNRDFTAVMGLPAKRYLMKIRFDAALDLLEAGGPIVEIAHACGYADQSAFARAFRYNIGVSPSEYRRARAV